PPAWRASVRVGSRVAGVGIPRTGLSGLPPTTITIRIGASVVPMRVGDMDDNYAIMAAVAELYGLRERDEAMRGTMQRLAVAYRELDALARAEAPESLAA